MQLRRKFLKVGARRVHYFRAGDGPPAVLVHSSPANARLLDKEIEQLAGDFTVFAFDTPGFGLSDPLPGEQLEVADLADALAETLAALAMPRCPVFGTHTGAAIALELGARYPARVTGLVLDGVPVFTPEERAEYFPSYFQKMAPSPLGGHYAEAWTRFRDQSIWFPWTNRIPKNLNPYDLGPPHSTHLWVSMFFEAAEHYIPAYRAASFYGEKAITAARSLRVPAVYCATESDMLYPHLDRLHPLGEGQTIAPIGTSYQRKRDLIGTSFAAFGADGPAPPDRDAVAGSTAIERQFIDLGFGQLHGRSCGNPTDPPLLLLHDAPGSSEQAEPLIAALAARFFVIAPDLPGCGESGALPGTPSIEDFAATMSELLAALGIATALVYGVGFGASVSLALAAHDNATHEPARVAALALQGVLLPQAEVRADLQARFVPRIAIEPDGAHWYRTWLMLRDSQVYWPWYDRRYSAARRTAADFGARHLHRWTMDVMRSRTTYAQIIAAALRHDAGAALRNLAVPLARVIEPNTPLSVFDQQFQDLAPGAEVLDGTHAGIGDALRMMFDHTVGTNRAYSETPP